MAASQAAVLTFVKGSTVRSKLLERLASEPHTPTELAAMESKHLSHVSRALVELRDMGLVASVDSGSRERYYKVTTQGYAIYATITMRTAK
jgi:DNA-binding transcriptional ArsR family regulator